MQQEKGGIYFFPDISTFVSLKVVKRQDFFMKTDRVVQTFKTGCNLLVYLHTHDLATTKDMVFSGQDNSYIQICEFWKSFSWLLLAAASYPNYLPI